MSLGASCDSGHEPTDMSDLHHMSGAQASALVFVGSIASTSATGAGSPISQSGMSWCTYSDLRIAAARAEAAWSGKLASGNSVLDDPSVLHKTTGWPALAAGAKGTAATQETAMDAASTQTAMMATL